MHLVTKVLSCRVIVAILLGLLLTPLVGDGTDAAVLRLSAGDRPSVSMADEHPSSGLLGVRRGFSTFLGIYDLPARGAFNAGHAVAVDDLGAIYVAGEATDHGLFTQDPIQARPAGFNDAFVLKLSGVGNRVAYGTYFGGSGEDRATSVAVDRAHNIYIAGDTQSPDFPITLGGQCRGSFGDAFITKLSPTGDHIIYSRCLGGDAEDTAFAMTVDRDGNAYVAGYTMSQDFPTLRPLQPKIGGGVYAYDVFVTKLDSVGELVYSTYLGGSHLDFAADLDVNERGEVVVVGGTDSDDFPTRNAIQARLSGTRLDFLYDAFVAGIAASGDKLLFSTYLGGRNGDQATGVAFDENARPVVVGRTKSADFPVMEPIVGLLRGSEDAFVVRLSSDGTQLDRATYFGGSGLRPESAHDVDMLPNGQVVVLGGTSADDFPVKGALQAQNGGENDLFVTILEKSMTSVAWSTYLGGAETEGIGFHDDMVGPGLAVAPSDSLVLTGATTSSDFPIWNALSSTFGGPRTGFVVKLQPGESQLEPAMPSACPLVMRRVPPAAVAAALANPANVMGWGRQCNPNVPVNPINVLRRWLTLLNPSRPYHPSFNPLAYKCGCP